MDKWTEKGRLVQKPDEKESYGSVKKPKGSAVFRCATATGKGGVVQEKSLGQNGLEALNFECGRGGIIAEIPKHNQVLKLERFLKFVK